MKAERMLIALVYLWVYSVTPLMAETQVIDLTYNLQENRPFYPGLKPFKYEIVKRGNLDNGVYVELGNFEVGEHYGTHMDSPRHMCSSDDCWRLHEIPVNRFRGPGVVIDVSARVSWPENRNDLVTVEDLKAWERRRGRRIPDGAILLLYSGWGKLWPDVVKYVGNDRGNTSDLHFPGLSAKAASWIAENRPTVSMVGVETLSVDCGQCSDMASHQTLFRSNIMVLENVAHLNELAPLAEDDDFEVDIVAMPIKILDGSGAPSRIVAYVSDREGNSAPNLKVFDVGVFAMWLSVGVGFIVMGR